VPGWIEPVEVGRGQEEQDNNADSYGCPIHAHVECEKFLTGHYSQISKQHDGNSDIARLGSSDDK
jgi:hypothetical protein